MAPQVTRFDIRIEDQASYDGHKVTVMELTGAHGLSQTAAVNMASGEVKTVQYRDLRSLAVGRPPRKIPDVQASIDEFVMWMDGDGEWIGGVVRVVEKNELHVHIMEGSTSGLAWLYLWTDGDETYRRLKKPDGAEPLEMTISADLVRVSGTLTKTNRLSDIMRRSMEDLEII